MNNNTPSFTAKLVASSFLFAAVQDIQALVMRDIRPDYFLFGAYGLGWLFLALTVVTLALDAGAGLLLNRHRLGATVAIGALVMTALVRILAPVLAIHNPGQLAAAVTAAGLPTKPFQLNVLLAMAVVVSIGAFIGTILVRRHRFQAQAAVAAPEAA